MEPKSGTGPYGLQGLLWDCHRVLFSCGGRGAFDWLFGFRTSGWDDLLLRDDRLQYI